MLRFLMTATGLMLIGVTIAGFLLLPHAERYAVPLLERGASEALGTPVTFESIRVSPLLPGVELGGVHVHPEGAPREPLLTCERVALRLDPSTVFTPAPVMTEMVLDGLVLHVRPGDLKDGALSRFSTQLAAMEAEGDLEIRKVKCVNGRISVAEGLLPGDGLAVPLDGFETDGVERVDGATVGLAALRRMLAPLAREKDASPGLRGLVEALSEGLPQADAG